jgi:hypothetical protein
MQEGDVVISGRDDRLSVIPCFITPYLFCAFRVIPFAVVFFQGGPCMNVMFLLLTLFVGSER